MSIHYDSKLAPNIRVEETRFLKTPSSDDQVAFVAKKIMHWMQRFTVEVLGALQFLAYLVRDLLTSCICCGHKTKVFNTNNSFGSILFFHMAVQYDYKEPISDKLGKAIANKCDYLARYIIQHYPNELHPTEDIWHAPLKEAIKRGHVDLVQLLLKNAGPKNMQIYLTLWNELVDQLVRQHTGSWEIFHAVLEKTSLATLNQLINRYDVSNQPQRQLSIADLQVRHYVANQLTFYKAKLEEQLSSF